MRNPVRTGDSCAAVSGYKLSGASLFAIRGEDGNKVSSQESEYSFDVALIRTAPDRRCEKLLRKKRRMRAATSPDQVALPTSGMTCYGHTIRFVNRGAFNFADFTNDNISRIEVIREPQSALYG